MWVCSSCREESDDDFDVCWSCGTGRDGSAPVDYEPVDPPSPRASTSALIPEPRLTGADAVDAPWPSRSNQEEESDHVAYDASIVQSYADHLYSRANAIEVVYTLIGLLLLGAMGLAFGEASGSGPIAAIIGAIVGAGIGYFVGSTKANALRLEAQMALCQVQIEANTRLR